MAMIKRDKKILEDIKTEEIMVLGKLVLDVFGDSIPRTDEGDLDISQIQSFLTNVKLELETKPENELETNSQDEGLI